MKETDKNQVELKTINPVQIQSSVEPDESAGLSTGC